MGSGFVFIGFFVLSPWRKRLIWWNVNLFPTTTVMKIFKKIQNCCRFAQFWNILEERTKIVQNYFTTTLEILSTSSYQFNIFLRAQDTFALDHSAKCLIFYLLNIRYSGLKNWEALLLLSVLLLQILRCIFSKEKFLVKSRAGANLNIFAWW